ncbi:hypothetical protein AX774_g2492 [Zancudomyces culisetae]|uniref:Uncharacterized protein n=1 Tax=Zancudomyces culisetae TaxID=1213189 RepID=A0A1R1PSR7_ZANCU|nr:hypothetical protein AX774_g2492 [Zancudomyces culisetae]|eukprot:OMH83991.1 hypothetical protein AX774_g2492 [Zancudomyces culisetae]
MCGFFLCHSGIEIPAKSFAPAHTVYNVVFDESGFSTACDTYASTCCRNPGMYPLPPFIIHSRLTVEYPFFALICSPFTPFPASITVAPTRPASAALTCLEIRK